MEKASFPYSVADHDSCRNKSMKNVRIFLARAENRRTFADEIKFRQD